MAADRALASLLVGILIVGQLVVAFLYVRGERAQLTLYEELHSDRLRTITIEQTSETPVSHESLVAVGALAEVRWVVARGALEEFENAALPLAGQRVAVARFWSVAGESPSMGCDDVLDEVCFGRQAMQTMQMAERGYVRGQDGTLRWSRSPTAPADVAFDSLVDGGLVWTENAADATVGFVRVANAADVDAVEAALRKLASASQRQLQVDSAADERRLLRVLIGRERLRSASLTRLAGALTTGVFSALVVAVSLNRRQEFGRRRVLGASRPTIVLLMLLRSIVSGCAAALPGIALSLTMMRWLGTEPSAQTASAIAGLLLGAAIVASLPAAAVACTADPLREFRVP